MLMITASVHLSGNFPVFRDLLRIRNFCLAFGPRFLIMSFRILPFTRTFFDFSFLMTKISSVVEKANINGRGWILVLQLLFCLFAEFLYLGFGQCSCDFLPKKVCSDVCCVLSRQMFAIFFDDSFAVSISCVFIKDLSQIPYLPEYFSF